MSPKTWNKLDKDFAEVMENEGRAIVRAEEVPNDQEIIEAARAIGCTFHHDYAEFLRRYGGAMVGSLPVYGLRPVEVMGNQWSVVNVTERFRDQGWPGVSDWYVISDDGYGNPIGIAPDGRVMISDHNFGGINVIALSFEEFLLMQFSED